MLNALGVYKVGQTRKLKLVYNAFTASVNVGGGVCYYVRYPEITGNSAT
jgi:hypothetical protein